MNPCLCRPLEVRLLGPLSGYNAQVQITFVGSAFQLWNAAITLPPKMGNVLFGCIVLAIAVYVPLRFDQDYCEREAAMTQVSWSFGLIRKGYRLGRPIELFLLRFSPWHNDQARKHQAVRREVYRACREKCIEKGHFCNGAWE